MRTTTREMAHVLVACSAWRGERQQEKHLAGLLNDLLGAEAAPALNDRQGEAALALFDALAALSPEAVELASRGEPRPGDDFDPIALGM
jgi:hypothetical protein